MPAPKTSPARGVTKERKNQFLRSFVKTGSLSRSAKEVGINVRSHYYWLENDPKYVKRYKAAEIQVVDILVQEARRRAVFGTKKPVFYKGVQCGNIREFSDVLLIFLLKAYDPERFRDPVKPQETDGELTSAIVQRLATVVAEAKTGTAGATEPDGGTGSQCPIDEVLPPQATPPATDVH